MQNWRTPDGLVIASGWRDGAVHWMHYPSLATFRFTADSCVVTASPEPGVHHSVIHDVFRRGVLPMALHARGYEALHASAVLGPTGVVAFAARSLSGKSTIAYGMSRRPGIIQWADDAVALSMSNGSVQAKALPFDVRLRQESADFFGTSASDPPRPGPDLVHARLPSTIALASVWLIEPNAQQDTPVEVEALPPHKALVQVLAHAHEFSPFDLDRRRTLLEAYFDLVAQVPVRVLRFRPGFSHFDCVLDAIDTTLR